MIKKLCKHSLSAIFILTSILFITSCGEESQTQEKPIEIKNIHAQLGDHLRVTFKNLVNESKTPSALALKENLSKVQGMLSSTFGLSLPEDIDVQGITKIIEIVFESELVKEIFAESNVTSRDDLQVTYSLSTSLCDKLSALVPSNNNTLVDSCRLLFENNQLEFRVKTPQEGMQLELWHARKTDGSELRFVVSLDLAENSLGARLDLDGSKSLMMAVAELMGDQPDALSGLIPGFSFEGLKQLSGALSLRLNFASQLGKSGCRDNGTFCVSANVDRDLNIEVDFGETLSLKMDSSDRRSPTLSLGSGANNSFKGVFNLGTIDGSYSTYHLFLENSNFNLIVPTPSEGIDFKFIVESFNAGLRPSYFEGFGKTFVLDLLNESRSFDSLSVAVASGGAQIDMSPLAINLSLNDETVEQCQAYENVALLSDAHQATSLEFSGLSPALSRSNMSGLSLSTALCDESNLFAYMMWSMLRVSSECDHPGTLLVKEGSIELRYGYHFNNDEEQSSTLTALEGQCIGL